MRGVETLSPYIPCNPCMRSRVCRATPVQPWMAHSTQHTASDGTQHTAHSLGWHTAHSLGWHTADRKAGNRVENGSHPIRVPGYSEHPAQLLLPTCADCWTKAGNQLARWKAQWQWHSNNGPMASTHTMTQRQALKQWPNGKHSNKAGNQTMASTQTMAQWQAPKQWQALKQWTYGKHFNNGEHSNNGPMVSTQTKE